MEEGEVELGVVDDSELVPYGNLVNVVDEDEEKYRFGCGPWRPAGLQKIFRNSIFFALILCSYALVEASIVDGTYSNAHTYD